MSLDNIRSLISGKDTGVQIWIDVEEYGDGYIIPPEILTTLFKTEPEISIALINTSAQNHEHAVPTGKYWIVKHWYARDSSRNSAISIYISVDGGTTYYRYESYTTGVTYPKCEEGWSSPNVPFRLNEGNKIKFEFTGFQAGDNVRSHVFYEEYPM
jgi:hypothetical protein